MAGARRREVRCNQRIGLAAQPLLNAVGRLKNEEFKERSSRRVAHGFPGVVVYLCQHVVDLAA